MKTTKIFFALSLALMITGMFAVNAMPTNGNGGPIQANNDVTYVVNIEHAVNPDGFNAKYVIIITDGRGQLVCQPQLFHMGTWTYSFKEHGTVTGTRVAHMVKDPNVIIPGAYIFTIDRQTGTFNGGRTYLFNLAPVPVKANENTPNY